MAKVKLATPIADIRGTLQGWTFSRNKSGNTATPYRRGPRLRTTLQTAHRQHIAISAAAWRDLTPTQRADWDTYAADPAQQLTNSMGDAYYASGFNWYVSLSTNLIRTGRSPIADAPTDPTPTAPTIDDFRVRPSGDNPITNRNGTPTASWSEAGFGPELAVDGIISEASTWVADSDPNIPSWYYDHDQIYTIRRYRYRDQPNQTANAPSSTALYGWTGAAWTQIHFTMSGSLYSTDWHTMSFDNSTAYKKYRLDAWHAIIPANYVGISEIEMYQDTFGYSFLAFPLEEFNGSPEYDLVLHVATAKTIGANVSPDHWHELTIRHAPAYPQIEIQANLETAFGTIQQGRPWFAHVFRQSLEGRRSAPTAIQTTS
jgi:hypothetical protein